MTAITLKLRNNCHSVLCTIGLLLLIFNGFKGVNAQSIIQLTLIDSSTLESVPFAAVINSSNQLIGTTDLDGQAKLKLELGHTYTIKSTSYKPKKFTVNTQIILIKMVAEEYQLQDVIITPGENPAHRLIWQAVKNRDINNPQKSCEHCYNAYNKLVFQPDEDTLTKEAKRHKANDSSFFEMYNFFMKQYLFMTESLTEKYHSPPAKSSEKIIANRVSGFETPLFSILATELQSFGYYEDYIKLMGIKYLNPISPGSTQKYRFRLTDTTFEGNDTIYSIAFEPRQGKSFKGLKGVLAVHTKKFSLKSIKAEPVSSDGGFTIHINQLYEYIEDKQWFPVQLNARLFLPPTISLNGLYLYGNNNGYITNIKFGSACKKVKTDEVELEIASVNKDTSIQRLQKSVPHELTSKEKNTYQTIDSIGKAENFEKRLNKFAQLLTGKIPVGFMNIDLNRLLAYNHYEGIRLGLGLSTNYKISKRHSLSGYGAYGFKDKVLKYGGDLKFLLYPRKQTRLAFSYRNDVIEAAAPVDYFEPITFLSPANARTLYLRKFDAHEQWQVNLSSRFLKHFHLNGFFNVQSRRPLYDYQYFIELNDGSWYVPEKYFVNETGAVLRFAFREKFVLADNALISQGTRFPVVQIKFAQSLNGLFANDFEYNRIDIKVDKAFNIRNLGKFTVVAHAGKINGAVPYTLINSFIPSYAQFEISVPNSFETMRMNEFAAQEYIMLFLSHNFLSNLFYNTKSKPQLELFTNAGYGRLKDSETVQHQLINLQSPDKGFFESGIRIHSLIRSKFTSLGLAIGYRYGAYAMNKFTDNAVIKLTTGFVVN